MFQNNTLLFTSLLASLMIVRSAGADVLAATDFDARTLTILNVANDTATNLNWTLNGLQDPGDMTALNASGNGVALFESDTTKVLFAPAVNTGNGNTFWTTSVNLTVVPGDTVTLTDVTFDYWAISGSAVMNVGRKSDFTISLFSPSAVLLGSVEIEDANAGNTVSPNVAELNATFAEPIPLSEAGTYTLQIKGGDFLVFNETGNHTAIDNLSINGTLDSDFSFIIKSFDYDQEGESITLTWTSRPGETFIVRYSFDLIDWSSDVGDNIAADAGETTSATLELPEFPLENAGQVFFRVEKE